MWGREVLQWFVAEVIWPVFMVALSLAWTALNLLSDTHSGPFCVTATHHFDPPVGFFWGSLCQKNPCQKIILPILFLEGRIWLFSQISCKFFHFLHLSPGLWVLAAPPWWVACKVCSWAPPHGQASLPRASSWRSGRRSPRQRNSPRPDRQHKN